MKKLKLKTIRGIKDFGDSIQYEVISLDDPEFLKVKERDSNIYLFMSKKELIDDLSSHLKISTDLAGIIANYRWNFSDLKV